MESAQSVYEAKAHFSSLLAKWSTGRAALSAGGYTFAISYTGGTGNDVVFTVQPKGTLISVW